MSEKQKTQAFLELLQAVLNEDARIISAFLEFEANGIRLRIDIDEERAPQPVPVMRPVDPAEVAAVAKRHQAQSDVPQPSLADLFNQVADAAEDQAVQHIAQEHRPAALANPECAPATDEEIEAMARASRASGTGSPPILMPRR